MGQGYTRQSSASIVTGEEILAAPLNAEFNAIQSAFHATTGHSHDGTTGEGPKLDITASVTGILPIANGGTNASTASAARTSLGLVIGTDVQAYDADLAAIAALAKTDSNFIVGNGTTWVAETGATARTSLGLGTIATQSAASVAITGGSITGITDLTVADGGTGASTASGARTNLGLGTAATVNTGTSGATIPLLNGTNTWSANNQFEGTILVANSTYGGFGGGIVVTTAGDLIIRPTSAADTFDSANDLLYDLANTRWKVDGEFDCGTLSAGAATVTSLTSSGALSATTGTFSSTLSAGAIDSTVIGGTTPAAGSFTTVTATGDITSGRDFISSSSAVVLAATEGGIFLRPVGPDSTDGQVTISNTGNITTPGNITATGALQGTVVTATTAFRTAAGTASAPSISFTGDTNTGFYSGTDSIEVSTGGTFRGNFTDTFFNYGKDAANAATAGISLGFNGQSIASVQDDTCWILNRIGTDGTIMQFRNDNVTCGTISIAAAATAYNTSSDGNLKTNLRAFDSGSIIDDIETWLFDWKSGGSGYGVIAQDCYEVFPDAITPPETDEDHWQADYSKFVPLLLAEVKALRVRVAELESKVNG